MAGAFRFQLAAAFLLLGSAGAALVPSQPATCAGGGGLVQVFEGVLEPNEKQAVTECVGCCLQGPPAVIRHWIGMVVETPNLGDLVVLRVWPDALSSSMTDLPASGTPLHAQGFTHASGVSNPYFEVEARGVAGPIAYTVVTCLVPSCDVAWAALG